MAKTPVVKPRLPAKPLGQAKPQAAQAEKPESAEPKQAATAPSVRQRVWDVPKNPAHPHPGPQLTEGLEQPIPYDVD